MKVKYLDLQKSDISFIFICILHIQVYNGESEGGPKFLTESGNFNVRNTRVFFIRTMFFNFIMNILHVSGKIVLLKYFKGIPRSFSSPTCES